MSYLGTRIGTNFDMTLLNRRTFLEGSAAALVAQTFLRSPTPAIPIIDCHIHLFDPTRPQGAPYAGNPGNKKPALPALYRKLAAPLGIVGAIEIEASPWIEDNLWVLEVEEKESIMLGMIGNLQPDKPEFGEYLDRYHKNKLFLGIRYGNLWGYDLVKQVDNPAFIAGLKLLHQADLTLDTANPRPDLLAAVLKITDKLPNLRVVIDHLPAMFEQQDPKKRKDVDKLLHDLAARPKLYVKVSEALKMANGKPSMDPAIYKPTFDYLFDTFGEDKLLFGSDWPNGVAMDNLPGILNIVHKYFNAKGHSAAEKYFWKNSLAAYKWIKRNPGQPPGKP